MTILTIILAAPWILTLMLVTALYLCSKASSAFRRRLVVELIGGEREEEVVPKPAVTMMTRLIDSDGVEVTTKGSQINRYTADVVVTADPQVQISFDSARAEVVSVREAAIDEAA